MEHKTRILRRDGLVIVKTVTTLTQEEYDGVQRIADDVHVNTDTIRGSDYDLSLGYLRLLCYWADLWANRETFPDIVTNAAKRRKELVNFMLAKAKSRKRRRK